MKVYQKGFSGVSSGLKSVTLMCLVNATIILGRKETYPVKSAVSVRIIILAVCSEYYQGWKLVVRWWW